MSQEDAVRYYISLLREQDEESTHRYIDDEFQIKENAVIVDAGAAEGIFALSAIDTVSKAFLIECDLGWIEALERTFAPWRDKVVIVKKMLCDEDGRTSICLDSLCEQPIDFLKMDIEGAEVSALLGADRHLKADDMKVAACTYHRHEDAKLIKVILERYNYFTKFNKGWMFFPYNKDSYKNPELRPGVIKGWKQV